MINFNELDYFSESEFPAGVAEYCDPAFMMKLNLFREALGCAVIPSPLPGGWFRHDGRKTSRHFVGPADQPVRLSDAGDVFVDCSPFHALVTAVECGFTGIGLYYDTQLHGKQRWMMHLDTRPGDRVIWERRSWAYKTIHPRPDSGRSTVIGYLGN